NKVGVDTFKTVTPIVDEKASTPVQPQSETVKDGWVKEEKGWTYYTNGTTNTGRAYSYLPTITANGKGTGSNWYLTDNGVVQSGVQQWADTYYDFDPTTYLRVDNNYVQSQWGDWYLFGNDGRILTKVQQWAGTYYYFDPVTYLRVDNDYRQSQWGDWYMFGPDGRIISGFINWNGSLYFFDPTTYLKLTNTYFNGNGYWNNWDTYWADNNGIVHGVHYFSQFTPVWAGWGCAGAALTMLLSIHNIWPGVGNVIAGIPQGGNGGQIGNPYNGAGFRRVVQPGALAAYGRRWYGEIADCTGASISQIVNTVLSGHPVLYYGYSPYDTGGTRNHCKIIYGYNRNNGYFHVYDPCYGNGGWGAYSEGRTAYDRGYNAWINWGQLASEYAGQAVSIY
uniref:C39 family peptidase n=1 Tax=Limosilactobacillus reuteri TaxID=1598 RepID=UPI00226F1C65